MKIQPPAGPPAGPSLEELQPGAKPDAAPGAKFADKLQSAAKPEAAGAAEKAGVASSPTMTAHLEAISRDLAAGRIETREQAIHGLVERVLDAKFGGKLPP